MATFDELCPDTDYVDFMGSPLLRCDTPQPCWHCGRMTHWGDASFFAFLCSEECARAKWFEYYLAAHECKTIVLYDVIVNGNVEESVRTCECNGIAKGYQYLKDAVLPTLVKKYNTDNITLWRAKVFRSV